MMQKLTVARRVLNYFGRANQFSMLVEEIAEMLLAIRHYERGKDTLSHVQEEVADVMFLCEQMAEAYGRDKVNLWLDLKRERIIQKIQNKKA